VRNASGTRQSSAWLFMGPDAARCDGSAAGAPTKMLGHTTTLKYSVSHGNGAPGGKIANDLALRNDLRPTLGDVDRVDDLAAAAT
jgi:hypothetical protein